ncbi:hypothetical protein Taro_050922, partial [Colocasia esculenta]|nr:hypothetical protein [Colocasia esculenta]
MEGKRRVVILGGGIAGGLLAKLLQFHADVVLVDPKEYLDIPWANLRARVEPSFAERTVISHSDYFTHGRLVTSSAVNVTDTEVMTKEGHNQKIKSSNSVLIIGGGPTGVELAAEIAVDYPDKKVILVQKGPRLLQFIGPKAAAKTLEWLTSKNVEVLLNQSIDLKAISEVDREFTTSTGGVVKADCYFDCTGRPLSSTWLRETGLKDCMDRQGRLVVDENLRVVGKKNIFAIGDITDVHEIKQGYHAQKHANVVAKNLRLLMRGASDAYLHKYKPGSLMVITTLGRKEAVAQLPLITMIGHIPGM